MGKLKFALIPVFAWIILFLAVGCGTTAADVRQASDPENTLIFLLIGQSNMEGKPRPEIRDLEKDSRIEVLAYENAAGRTYNKWYTASPPLHSSWAGVGPGDYFAKTLIEGLPEGYSIGLVPCGISGVDIDFFRKGVVSARRNEFSIPPDNSWDGAYDWVMERALIAKKKGRIAGVLFHQGESDAGQSIWLAKINGIINDLRNDLDIPDLPLLVGELYYGGPCAGHNSIIARVPDVVDNAYVISAEGLNGADQYHFDLDGQRELGKRYGRKMLKVLGY